ncbi:hypothetical protein [Salipaludibacillus sp. CF4.18]|uniref:hypothetical protein n=1 Tax=Salipaludibacillus sp. CF4.18 TaxID=3373081 RepID=UPI003EE63F9C
MFIEEIENEAMKTFDDFTVEFSESYFAILVSKNDHHFKGDGLNFDFKLCYQVEDRQDICDPGIIIPAYMILRKILNTSNLEEMATSFGMKSEDITICNMVYEDETIFYIKRNLNPKQ